ncbi:hypothetical protein [Spirosoma areae]
MRIRSFRGLRLALFVSESGGFIPFAPKTSLIRQLEPFSLGYQQEVLNRLPGKH